MTIEERAEQFALEALKEQIEKVKQAYIAGYKECEENYKKITVDENGLTWYDLDLPSGNLWSEPLKDEDGELIQCNYNSVKHLNLPTIGDLKELRIYTRNHTSDDFDNYHYYCRKSENTDKYLIPVGHRFWLREKNSKQ